MTTSSPRGFTLLIALILTSVLLTVGLSMVDTAYKQLILASTAKQSETAFYRADAALECALYYDQKIGSFAYGAAAVPINCKGQSITVTASTPATGVKESTFSVPCTGAVVGTEATVTVRKTSGIACNAAGATTCLYSNGYSSCSVTDPRRVERGVKSFY